MLILLNVGVTLFYLYMFTRTKLSVFQNEKYSCKIDQGNILQFELFCVIFVKRNLKSSQFTSLLNSILIVFNSTWWEKPVNSFTL